MKRLLTILFLSIGLTVFSQDKKDSITVNDSTLLFSVNDLQPLYKELKKLPYEQAEPFIKYIRELVGTRVEEYRKKKKQ